MVRGDGRVTYSRRHAYHTKSNKAKVVKTPGGKLVAHFHKKSAKGPVCGDSGCNISLPGVSRSKYQYYFGVAASVVCLPIVSRMCDRRQ